MSQFKQGLMVLAFCWSGVRRDFIPVGKGWPQFWAWFKNRHIWLKPGLSALPRISAAL
jgi:hypothetical protein